MAKRRAKSQIANLTLDQKKSGIDPIYLAADNVSHITWKALDKSYNFALDRTSIRGLLTKLWGSKVAGGLIGAILELPLGSPGREKPFGYRFCGQPQSIP
jgi:hypothetical protein